MHLSVKYHASSLIDYIQWFEIEYENNFTSEIGFLKYFYESKAQGKIF